MKTLFVMTSLFIFILFSPVSFANGVIVTHLTSCGYNSQDSGEFIYVDQDLQGSNSDDCIDVLHSGVTIDCQGYRLTGLGDSSTRNGIHINNMNPDISNVKVQNCELYGWYKGIQSQYADWGVFEHNKFAQNRYWGLVLENSDHGTVRYNKGDDNRICIYFYYSDEAEVHDNTCHRSFIVGNPSGAGIYLYYSDGSLITDNQTNGNEEHGIRLDYSDNAEIYFNTSNLNGASGLRLFYSLDAKIEKNKFNKNEGYGIERTVGSIDEFGGNVCRNNGVDASFPEDYCK